MMPLAFAPFMIWPIAIVSPAVLIFLLRYVKSTSQAFWLGWLFGLGYFGFGVNWIYNSLHVFGHAPVIVAAALTALMIITLSVFIGFAIALYFRLIERHSMLLVVFLLPLIWFSVEWFKGWVLTGFPWLSIGYAHLVSPLSGFAPLVGVYGLSALSILISMLVIQWVQKKKWTYPLLIVFLFLLGSWLQQIEWSEPEQKALTITLVQGNIPQQMKWRPDDRQKIIDIYRDVTQSHWSSDLVIWPEVAIPGRSEDLEAELLIPLSTQASDNGSHLLTGIIVSDWLRRVYYNSMLLLGDNEGVYHKRHLVPFGEYYPFRKLLSFMESYIRIPMSDMSSGPDSQALLKIKDVKLGVSICFEDVFSRDINRDLPNANILINTSNDAWFGDSLAPHQHLQIAQMRALETARPMVRSTNTGSSAFIDHNGNILEKTDQFKAQTLTLDLQGRTGSTPFLSFEKLQASLAGIILLISFYYSRVSKKKNH